MSIFEWVVTVLAAIVAIFVGIQQFSATARQRRKDVAEQNAERIRQQDQFLRDWAGESYRPGHPATPGVMERLQKIESELRHNGGSSIKDAVKRIENKLTKIDERLDEGNHRFEDIEERIK
jgi:C4-dicarboxylate-specific signal transduction histidine kinase